MQYIFYLIYYIAWTLILPILILLAVTIVPKWRPGLIYKLGNLDTKKFPLKSKFNKLSNDTEHSRPIWFHAVSVGELNALIPLLKIFHDRTLVLSVTTETAHKMALSKLKDEIEKQSITLIYMPWDHPYIIANTLNRISPKAVILMESEIWPALIYEANKRKIKTIIINAKLSDSSYKLYKNFEIFVGWIFKKLDLILAQSPADSRKYISLNIDKSKIFMTGNIKFSTLPNVKREKAQLLRSTLGYQNTDIVWVCGSTHPEEEATLVAIFQELKTELPNLRLILAPRHPERFSVVETVINSAAKLIPVHLSKLKTAMYNYASFKGDKPQSSNLIKLAEEAKGKSTEVNLEKMLYEATKKDQDFSNQIKSANDILLLDTIGDLMDIYSIADIAFVGGTLNESVGGHNVLEPATCRVPVVIGPHFYKNTYMVELMEEAGGLIVTETKEELRLAILDLAINPDKRILMGAEAKNLTERNKQIIIEVTNKVRKEIF